MGRRVVGKVGQFDHDLDCLANLVFAQTIPEMFKSGLAVALRQTRVEYELQGANEVALADFVFADHNDAAGSLNIDFGKIGEIAYLYPRDAH